MNSSIDKAMQEVDWREIEGARGDGLYATHAGTIDLVFAKFPVYRLNDGQCVVDADAVEKWLTGGGE